MKYHAAFPKRNETWHRKSKRYCSQDQDNMSQAKAFPIKTSSPSPKLKSSSPATTNPNKKKPFRAPQPTKSPNLAGR